MTLRALTYEMLVLALTWVTLMTTSVCWGAGGGSGVGNGGGKRGQGTGTQTSTGLTQLQRSYTYGGYPGKYSECLGKRFPEVSGIQKTLIEQFHLQTNAGSPITTKLICASTKRLDAYRSFLEGALAIFHDVSFRALMKRRANLSSNPIVVKLEESSLEANHFGVKSLESTWVSPESGELHWAQPDAGSEGTHFSLGSALGRWEAPLLMHELGHVFIFNIFGVTRPCFHDLRPLDLPNSKDFHRDLTPESFFTMQTDPQSAFFEAFSNWLEIPFLLIHPMNYDGYGNSLETANPVRRGSLYRLLSNEAYLTTIGFQYLRRPHFDEKNHRKVSTHPTDNIIPRMLSWDVLDHLLHSMTTFKLTLTGEAHEPSSNLIVRVFKKAKELAIQSGNQAEASVIEGFLSSFLQEPGKNRFLLEIKKEYEIEFTKLGNWKNAVETSQSLAAVKAVKAIMDGWIVFNDSKREPPSLLESSPKVKSYLSPEEILEALMEFKNGLFYENRYKEAAEIFFKLTHFPTLSALEAFLAKDYRHFARRTRGYYAILKGQ